MKSSEQIFISVLSRNNFTKLSITFVRKLTDIKIDGSSVRWVRYTSRRDSPVGKSNLTADLSVKTALSEGWPYPGTKRSLTKEETLGSSVRTNHP
jgi:hypothetical protein